MTKNRWKSTSCTELLDRRTKPFDTPSPSSLHPSFFSSTLNFTKLNLLQSTNCIMQVECRSSKTPNFSSAKSTFCFPDYRFHDSNRVVFIVSLSVSVLWIKIKYLPIRDMQQERMEYEVKKYEKYKRDLKFMLVGSGLWPNYHRHPRYLRIILSLCSAFGNGATAFGIINFCLHHITNINILTRGLGLMISFSSAFLKVGFSAKFFFSGSYNAYFDD